MPTKNCPQMKLGYDTKVLVLQVEREVRERVINSLHREAMMWMDRFTFTLNGGKSF